MTTNSSSLQTRFRFAAIASGLIVILIGAAGLTGWLFNLAVLRSLLPGLTPMKANTGFGLILAGAALLLSTDEAAARWSRRAAAGCAVVILLLGLLTLGEYLFDVNPGIDQWLFQENPGATLTGSPGRMGPHTALCFVLTGGALLLIDAQARSLARLAQGMMLVALLIALAVLIGYGYGVAYLLRLVATTQMSLPTALGFVVLSGGLIAARRRRPIAALLSGASVGSMMFRQMWPQTILLLFLLGWLRLVGERAGLYATSFGTAMHVLSGMVLFSLLIWRAARTLDRLDIERREAEASEREADTKLRITLRSIGDAVISTDAAGHVSFINTVAEQLTGWTQTEADGRPLTEIFRIVNEQTRTEIENPVMKVISEGVTVGLANHTILIARDGRETPIDDSGAPIRDETGEVVGAVLVFRDITERRQAEKTMSRLAVIVESSDDAIISLDLNGIILSWNKGAENLFGFTAEEIIGQPITTLIPAERAEDESRVLNSVRGGEKMVHYETVRRRKDGSLVEISLSVSPLRDGTGRIIGASKIARDITARKRVEEELRYQLDLTRTITDNTQSCLLMIDAEGRTTFANPACKRITGYQADELIGAVLHNKLHHTRPDGAPFPIDECPLDRALPISEAVVGYEDNFLHKDGHFYPVRCAGRPIFKEGKPVGTVIEVQDISEEKRLFAAERQARELAEQANRLKDEFLATVSHELRTPLNHMLGWILLLRGGRLAPDKAAEALDTIERNARAQNRLVDDLLDVSRIVTGKLQLHIQSVIPAQVIEAAVASARPAAEARGVRLEVILDSRPGVISGDPDRLQQIIWNLVSNAIRFTPKGGRVQVRLEHAGSHIEILVSDTGEGIQPEFLPQVFDRFSQADSSFRRRHGGLGLGLAIVRHLVELHGGEVSASSPGLGQGATFTVRLPLSVMHCTAPVPELPEISVQSRTAVEGLQRLDGVRVLVVDDEAEARLLLATILTQNGAEARTAGSMLEAIRSLDTWAPDVLVSDIGMPNGDGYDLIRRVRQLNAATGRWLPAVALTAYAHTEDRMRALAAGFQMHVTKPVEPRELLMVIASLTGRLIQS